MTKISIYSSGFKSQKKVPIQDQSKMQFLTSTTGEKLNSEYERLHKAVLKLYHDLEKKIVLPQALSAFPIPKIEASKNPTEQKNLRNSQIQNLKEYINVKENVMIQTAIEVILTMKIKNIILEELLEYLMETDKV